MADLIKNQTKPPTAPFVLVSIWCTDLKNQFWSCIFVFHSISLLSLGLFLALRFRKLGRSSCACVIGGNLVSWGCGVCYQSALDHNLSQPALWGLASHSRALFPVFYSCRFQSGWLFLLEIFSCKEFGWKWSRQCPWCGGDSFPWAEPGRAAALSPALSLPVPLKDVQIELFLSCEADPSWIFPSSVWKPVLPEGQIFWPRSPNNSWWWHSQEGAWGVW